MSPARTVLRCLTVLLIGTAGCRSPNGMANRGDATARTPTALGEPRQVLEAPPLPASDEEPFRLGPGDVVEIDVIGVPGTRRRCLVMPDGMLYFDLLAGQRVGGLTLDELRRLLEGRLAEYYVSPQVGLALREIRSRRAWILGRVGTPGLYVLDQPTTLLEAVARAGGMATSRFSGTTEELADLSHSFLLRDGEPLPVDFRRLFHEGDLSQNVRLRSGDYV